MNERIMAKETKEEVLKFCDSCLNLSLRQKDHFISAFPGKIVFGKCNPLGYTKKKYFEFKIFDLYKLYLAIFDIIKYFSGETILEKQLFKYQSFSNIAIIVLSNQLNN